MNFEDLEFSCPMTREEFDTLWVKGAILYQDAEILYTLMRLLKPQHIIELGAFQGLSTKILAMAVRENGIGRIISVDKTAPGKRVLRRRENLLRSELLSKEDLEVVELVTRDVTRFMRGEKKRSVDFIFEDSSHLTETMVKLVPAILRALKPDGVVLFHNSLMPTMKKGFEKTRVKTYLRHFWKCCKSDMSYLRGDFRN